MATATARTDPRTEATPFTVSRTCKASVHPATSPTPTRTGMDGVLRRRRPSRLSDPDHAVPRDQLAEQRYARDEGKPRPVARFDPLDAQSGKRAHEPDRGPDVHGPQPVAIGVLARRPVDALVEPRAEPRT